MTALFVRACSAQPVLGPGDDRFREKAFALSALAGQFPRPPDGLGLPTRLGFGRLLVSSACLHFPEDALALHLLLERLQRLVDVVVTDHDHYDLKLSIAAPIMVLPRRVKRVVIMEHSCCPRFSCEGGRRARNCRRGHADKLVMAPGGRQELPLRDGGAAAPF
jgi:hypothetical protein